MSTLDESPVLPDEGGEERELCRTCLTPNEPGATFCKDCGAPMSSYAATGPFEHLLAEGHVYRSAVERPHNKIVLLGVWLLFGGFAATGLVLLVDGLDGGPATERLLGFFLTVVGVVVVWRTTRNYFKGRTGAPARRE